MTWPRLLHLHHRSQCDVDAFTAELRSHRLATLAYQSAIEPTTFPISISHRMPIVTKMTTYVAAALISLDKRHPA